MLPLHALRVVNRGGLQRRSGADKAKIKELEREVKELRTANEILKKA